MHSGTAAVATIREIVNVQLLRGMVGKRGAGLCPVRGHSNVQGDRTMGIWHVPPKWARDAPAKPGFDTVDAIRAMRDGRARVFVGMGGNFAAATPDTAVTEAVDKGCPIVLGGPLPHALAAKAVALREASQPSFRDYARRIVQNSQALAEAFMSEGMDVITGGTDNHLLLLDVHKSFGLTGR